MRTKTIYVEDLEDGRELELTHESDGDVTVSILETKIVAGYLVRDEDAENPMNDCDTMGDFYLYNERNSIWNKPKEFQRELELDGDRWGDPSPDPSPDLDQWFTTSKGVSTTLWTLAAKAEFAFVKADYDLMSEALEEFSIEPEEGQTIEQTFSKHSARILKGMIDHDSFRYDETETRALALYAKHWKELAGHFVIPINYSSERGSTSIGVTEWDGDYDDPPDGVWVANEYAIENILNPWLSKHAVQVATHTRKNSKALAGGEIYSWDVHEPVYHLVWEGEILVPLVKGRNGLVQAFMRHIGWFYLDEIREAAVKYATSVCSEMEAWASGDVYGVVVETYDKTTLDPEDYDACWGFIGLDYAKSELKSRLEYAINQIDKSKLEVTQ